MLWSLTGNVGYHLNAAWKLPLPAEGKLPPEDMFIVGFRGGGWIQELAPGPATHAWPFAPADAWLAVPLSHRGDLVGFVFLTRSHHAFTLDWESFDLLRAQPAGRKLSREHRPGLLDAALLTDYTRRFAFVVHDIKNLATSRPDECSSVHR